MNLLPSEHLVIETSLYPDEVRQRLDAVTRKPSRNLLALYSGEQNQKFWGRLSGYSFELIQILHYGNSFQPIIRGTIEARASGSFLRISMCLHERVTLVMLFLLSMLSTISLFLIRQGITSQSLPQIILPASVFLLWYLVCMGGFKLETARVRRTLNQLLHPPSPYADESAAL